MQSGLGALESRVAINPYFKKDSWYCLLNAALFFLEVVGSSSVSSLGFFPFAKKLILLACGFNLSGNVSRNREKRQECIIDGCNSGNPVIFQNRTSFIV